MFSKNIKNKAAGSYLCLAAALVALITGIVFFATQAEAAPLGHTGIVPGIILLSGAVISLVLFVFPIRFGALIQAITYSVAMYYMVVQLYIVFADVINHVTYAGGNAQLCVGYMVGALLAALLSVIACFFRQNKDDREELDEAEAKARFRFSGIGVIGTAVVLIACAVVVNKADSLFVTENATAGVANKQMNYADNTFVNATLEELTATDRSEWEQKIEAGEVTYFFEGQYTEGFGTSLDPYSLDMYCFSDGSLYGTFSGPETSLAMGQIETLYGYWYNVDENGEDNFVIHLTGRKKTDGSIQEIDTAGGADADVFIFATEHGAYSWEASMSFSVMDNAFNRNVNIYGQEYVPAQSITIDASNARTFYTGDYFDPSDLKVTVVRGNGAEESIWNGRVAYSGFDSDEVGKKTVTGSFLGASTTFEVDVEALVAEHYTGEYDIIMNKLLIEDDPKRTEAVLELDYSHMVCHIVSTDGTLSIDGTLVAVDGKDIKMIMNGSEELDVTIVENDGVAQVTIPEHQEHVGTWTPMTFDIPEATFTIAE